MFSLKWRSWMLLLPLLLLVGCYGTSTDDKVTIRAQYEKRILTPSGFSTTTEYRPARYCYAEVFRGDNRVLSEGYLDSNGTMTLDVPNGTEIWVRVTASFEVPNATGTAFFMRGSTVNAHPDVAFDQTSDWYMESDNRVVDGPGTLTLSAKDSDPALPARIAGAFSIADQAVAFGLKLRGLEPTLRLPNLHTYWNTSTNPAHHERTYPQVVMTTAGRPFLLDGRAVFTHAVNGCRTGAANTETDEYDDAVLQETFSRLLFADRSLKEDGSSVTSLLRRDNDNVYVSRYRQAESTAAFAAGFCDFLAGVIQNDSRLLDSYVDATGVPRVDLFDLGRHDQVPTAERSEFTRGSIAVSLWGISNALGSSGLQTIWSAVRSSTTLPDGTGELNGATLGCYPSYLLGVKSRATSSWSSIVAQLALESIPEPTTAYFAGNALYITQPAPVFTVSGLLKTYSPSEGRYYDRDQSQAYRFTLPATATRTITVTPMGGQDFYVELLGPGGWWGGKTGAQALGQRTFTVTGLTAGAYAVRVRAGDTTATATAGYTLQVQ